MSEIQRIDMGNMDWLVKIDDNGRVWVSPSLDWKDGEVYESLRNQNEIYTALRRAGVEL